MTSVKKNVGLIEYKAPGKVFQMGEISGPEVYVLKKIFTAGEPGHAIRSQYPDAEIVEDTQSIIKDNSIDLVIISSATGPDLSLAGEVLRSGKNLRIM
jgi:scyllo-inositol 2-dehydrogenase (NADP+)